LAEQILNEEIPKGVSSLDHHFVGRLEHRFRSAGVEDLIILLTNGDTVPAPPSGATLRENFSVSVAVEYRGHWIRLSRPHGTPEVLRACQYHWNSRTSGPTVYSEMLDGSYPYEWSDNGNISACHVEYNLHGKRLFYGETIL